MNDARAPMLAAHRIERGSLVVLCDVVLTPAELDRLERALVAACGHDQFVVLRVWSSDPVTVYDWQDIALALASPVGVAPSS